MPPKKKSGKGKKKSSGKKKKAKKSATTKEPKLTVEEAIVDFQIEVKQRSFEDLIYDLQSLQEKNGRLKDRNQRLKEEQLLHINNLLKQVKEKDKEVEKAMEVGHEQVETALLEKFDTMKNEKAEVQELNEKIQMKEAEIMDVRRRIKKLEDYRDIGAEEHAKQIILLKQDLKEMQDSHDDIAAHLERSLKIARDEISTYTESTILQQKDIANEKATNNLDKDSCGEILDNRWLKKEVAIHREAHANLSVTVESLEKRNLDIMSELFDCKVEDIKFTRKFYLSCIDDDEEDSSGEENTGEDEELIASHGVLGEGDEKPDDLLDNYFLPGEDEFQQSPRLGPMELQLLSVIGTIKPINVRPPVVEESTQLISVQETGATSRPASYASPQNWPVTNNMLQSLTIQ